MPTYRRLSVLAGSLGCLLLTVLATNGRGQDSASASSDTQNSAEIPWSQWVELGVAEVIPPKPSTEETYTGPRPLTEIVTNYPQLDWESHFSPPSEMLYNKSSSVILRRQIWSFEFSFKPVRMIQVDVPQADGRMQQKLIWYMIYGVRYLGSDLTPNPTQDEWGQTIVQFGNVSLENRRFFPLFVLESHEFQKSYLDRIIPAAQEAIERRETPGNKLYNSVEITKVPIPLSDERTDRGVTGVVMWEDVDPAIDFFSVYVKGLTNAYRYEDPQGAYSAGDPPATGRVYLSKTLQLNFWRPGDTVLEHEGEIRFGVPADRDPVMQQQILERFGLEDRLDHRWVYR